MKVQEIEIRNFMGIAEATLQLNGDSATLGGKNGAGKTSILHAVWTAALGRPAQPARPVHGNALTASIKIKLTDGHRIYKEYDSEKGNWKTTIYDDEKCKIRRPQEFLDELVGSIPIDPHAFINMDGKKQSAALLQIVGGDLDLASFDEGRRRSFDRRTDVNRSIKTLTAQIEGYRNEDIPDDAEYESATELLAEIAEIDNHNRAAETTRDEKARKLEQEIAGLIAARREADTDIGRRERSLEGMRDQAKTMNETMRQLVASEPPEDDERCNSCPMGGAAFQRIAELQQKIDANITEGKKQAGDLKKIEAALQPRGEYQFELDAKQKHIDEMPAAEGLKDDTGIKVRLQSLEENNRIAKKAEDRELAIESRSNLEAEVETLNTTIDEIDREKQDALEGAKMPIPGLGFDLDEGGLFYKGVPFKQIAHSEQMAVAFSLLVAQEPKLELITITDASLLDAETMAALEKAASTRGFQVLTEEVADEARPGIFYIEKGAVTQTAA